jgi:phage baseplate assembly protein W
MAKILSTEDGNLSGSALTTAKTRLYSDIDLSFEPNVSSNGDIYKKKDAAAVKQSIKNLILTNRFEKPFRPNFGGNLRGMLFELSAETTADEIEDTIIRNIEQYEPRAVIKRLFVDVNPDSNSMLVDIEFLVVNTQETVSFQTSISRLR